MPAKTRRSVDQTQTLILDAAANLFHSEGYARTSLDTVAAEAGVTKPTVYSHFRSKQGLFQAVVDRVAQERLGKLEQALATTGDPGDDLLRFGELFLSIALNPETQRWDRLAAAECLAHPEVGELFFQSGPAKLLKRLTQLLAQYDRDGLLVIPKPAAAAEQLIGLLIGIEMLRSSIGLKTLSVRQQKQRAKEAVRIFLAAFDGEQV